MEENVKQAMEENVKQAMESQAEMLEKVLRRKKISSWKVMELKLFLIARGVSEKGTLSLGLPTG